MSEPNRKFTIAITGSVTLSKKDVWPDGDAPESPTTEDVLGVLQESGRIGEVLLDWNMEEEFDWEVT